jgi:hypothetical protein
MVFPTVGLALFGLALIGIALFLGHLSAWQTSTALGAAGLFMGTTVSTINISVQTSTVETMLGRATAFVQLSRTVGSSLGVGVGSLIYFRGLNSLSAGCTTACGDAVRPAFVSLLLFLAALSLLAAMISRQSWRYRLA